MKKFAYSLQYLLDVHSAKEQAAEHELNVALSEQRMLEAELSAMEATYADQSNTLASMQGVVKRADYAVYTRSIGFIRRDLDALNVSLGTIKDRVETHRETLRKEMVMRRILENLCEREREEWAETLLGEEQKQMDEVAAIRWSRQGR